MHDFIQNLSFNSQSPFPATRPASEVLRSLTRSFNEVTAYRPSAQSSKRAVKRRGQRSLSSQLSTLN